MPRTQLQCNDTNHRLRKLTQARVVLRVDKARFARAQPLNQRLSNATHCTIAESAPELSFNPNFLSPFTAFPPDNAIEFDRLFGPN